MHALEFLKHSDKARDRPITAIHGDDEFLRRETQTRVIRELLGPDPDEMAISRFAGDSSSLADVLDELRTLPFLSSRRVVIVEDAEKFVSAHRKELEVKAERPAGTGFLILMVKTWAGTTRLAKIVAKTGLDIDCKAPAEKDLPAWVIGFARSRCGAVLQAPAAGLLLELVGPEIGLLASEVEKLAVYVGPEREITREDVARMVGAGRVETVWRTVDAATLGHAAEALRDLDQLMASGEHPVGLLAAMTFSLRKIHHAGVLRMANLDLESAARQAGVQAGRVADQHKHLGPTRVDRIPEMLLAADLDLKGSSTLPPDVVLERLIVELVRKRRDPKPATSGRGRS
ncbi:MAG: DNA polymerase III subunit delta [Isosphaeraceae bacterium]|nr:DNA polymerase III subunit delta [Isosphaeraceae bacterium]